MKSPFKAFMAILPLLAGLAGCTTDFEVFSEAKEAYVVYGVMDAKKDTQFVKVTRVFQTDGDAVAYVAEQDVTVRNLDVRLVNGGNTVAAVLVDSMARDSGIFMPGQAVYAIPTLGGNTLQPGETYQLEIRKPDQPDFLITASTIIPDEPYIRSPRGPYTSPGGRYTWPTIDFENDQQVMFDGMGAYSWEFRLGFHYLIDSVPATSIFKMRNILLPEDACESSAPRVCYPLPAAIIPRWILSLTEFSVGEIQYSEHPRVVSTVDSLPKVCYVEITAIDQQLTTFLRANEPGTFGLNLLMDKQEYSNISGDHYGIFGSINTNRSWIFMSECTQYLGGLVTGEPPGCSF